MTTMTDVDGPRRRRSDAGSVRFNERDMSALGWLLSMKAIYESDLPVLLRRLTGAAPGPSATRSLVDRWQRAGVASARKLIVGRPRIVRLLPDGARMLGDESFRETSEFTAMHQADTTRVRLYLEGSPLPGYGPVTGWESEREFRAASRDLFGAGAKKLHTPDGVALYGAVRAALEVERSVKSPNRRARIMAHLIGTYPLVIFAVTDKRVGAMVEATYREQRELAERHVPAASIGQLRLVAIPEALS
jgi:hypothetical protein